MFRLFTKISRVLCICMAALTTAGVSATWYFSVYSPMEANGTATITLSEFKWDGAEVLPDGGDSEDTDTNHNWLIQNLVYGEEIGLNTRGSIINDYIEDRLDGGFGYSARDYFGSMAVTGGDEVEKIFGTEAEGVSFIIHVLDDLNYEIFTTSVYLGERGEINFWGNNSKPGKPTVPIGDWVSPVYRTTIHRTSTNTDWEIMKTEEGKAKSDWYDENRRNANATQIPSFDPDTWQAGAL